MTSRRSPRAPFHGAFVFTATLAAVSAVAPAAEVPVFVFAGQSNAVGASTSPSQLTGPLAPLLNAQSNSLFFGPNAETSNANARWNPLVPPTELTGGVTGGPGVQAFGPEITTGRTISANLLSGGTVASVKFAYNGSNLYQQWNPAASPPTGTTLESAPADQFLYARMKARVDAGLARLPLDRPGDTGRVKAFFWMQGESDTGDAATSGAYAANLTALITKVRADFGDPNLPFVIGQINYAPAFTPVVRAAQFEVARTLSNVRVALTDDLPRSMPGGYDDRIHFSTAGIVGLGERFAQTYAEILNPPAPTPNVGGLLKNGSFEDQDTYHWTVVNNPTNPSDNCVMVNEGATNGIHAMIFGRAGTASAPLAGVNGGPYSISQAITLTPGQKYRLSFDFGNFGPSASQGTSSVALRVGLTGSDLATFTLTDTTGNGYAADATVFSTYMYEFTATAPNVVLSFTDVSTNAAAADAVLDNISITAVPEPASMGAVALAAGAALLRRRRR